jgi:hypothetical protein
VALVFDVRQEHAMKTLRLTAQVLEPTAGKAVKRELASSY